MRKKIFFQIFYPALCFFFFWVLPLPGTTVYLVRHAQTDWNLKGRMQSIEDNPINDTGILQARCLAEKFKDIPFGAVFTSGKRRTNETADIIVAGKSLEIISDARLTERHYGEWEGRCKADFSRARPEEKTNVEANDHVTERALAALNSIASKYPEDDVLVVSHGSVLRNIVASLRKISPHSIKPENTGYVILTNSNGNWAIEESYHITNRILQD